MTKSFARSSNISVFANISRNSLKRSMKLYEKLINRDDEIKKCEDEEEASYLYYKSLPLRMKLFDKSVIAIVFSAMALEAYIYDYTARELGDSFTRKHLDKLDVSSKYIVGIQLIHNVKFPKDKEVFYTLRELIKERNEIIHSKSKDIKLDDHESLLKQSNSHFKVYEFAKIGVKALDCMIEYIGSLDPEEPIAFLFGEKNQ